LQWRNLPTQCNCLKQKLLHNSALRWQRKKKVILDHFQEASKACWKQFAVNDCLFKAKQQKYQTLSPLDQREIALNARQRVLKELERQQRISDKTQETPKDKAMP